MLHSRANLSCQLIHLSIFISVVFFSRNGSAVAYGIGPLAASSVLEQLSV
jgi:hypothetical protein